MRVICFPQGDREKELGLPCSPLCDRQTTLVEKSQIGFIDFIVEPSFNMLGDMMEKIVEVLNADSKTSKGTSTITEEDEGCVDTYSNGEGIETKRVSEHL